MNVAREIRASLAPLVDLVYPPRCPACGEATADPGGLCAACWSALEAPGEPACVACGQELPAGAARETPCGRCLAAPPQHAGIVAPFLYNDASRALVLAVKHGGKIALARLMGRMMAARLDDPHPGDETVLVPVPLHRLRLWERGYNQAALLARELADHGKGELCVDALIRRKRTPSLGGLGREARREALAGAIIVRESRRARLKGRDVLLVDDVYTSGATSSACVAALIGGGARSVRVVCFARVAGA